MLRTTNLSENAIYNVTLFLKEKILTTTMKQTINGNSKNNLFNKYDVKRTANTISAIIESSEESENEDSCKYINNLNTYAHKYIDSYK